MYEVALLWTFIISSCVFLSDSANDQVMQCRPDHIRVSMFPDDSIEVPSTQIMRNQQTNLQRLSQPAQILKATLSGLATYQVN